MRTKLFTLTALLAVTGTVLAGCTTLPPAKPVWDLSSIAGTWEGTATTLRGTSPFVLTIKEDGSYEGTLLGGIPEKREGIMRLRDGKIRWESYTIVRTGTFTLYEGEGKRVLKGSGDKGGMTIEMRPAK
jgi:hypothetical protein